MGGWSKGSGQVSPGEKYTMLSAVLGGVAREQGAKAFSGTWDSPTAEAPQEADFGSGSGRADPANPCLRAAVPRQRGCSGRRVLSTGTLALSWSVGATGSAQMVSLPPSPHPVTAATSRRPSLTTWSLPLAAWGLD